MTEAQHLAESLTGLFAENNVGWFISFRKAVAGLTAEQAARVPGEGFNSVWEVVNHLGYWNDIPLHLLRDELPDAEKIGGGSGWPPVEDAGDDSAWRAASERAISNNEALARHVATMSSEDFDRAISAWNETKAQMIHGVIAHNSYHICEIISIRHMLGLWLENT